MICDYTFLTIQYVLIRFDRRIDVSQTFPSEFRVRCNSYFSSAADDSLVTDDEDWSTINDDEMNTNSMLNHSSASAGQVDNCPVLGFLCRLCGNFAFCLFR